MPVPKTKEDVSRFLGFARQRKYTLNWNTTVESDHKPLQAICAKPLLLSAPMRLQAMLLILQPYNLNVTYKPGKDIPMGDALSRAHLPDAVPDIEPVMVNIINFIAVTPTRYKQFQECTANELNELHAMIQNLACIVRMYWTIHDELSVSDGVVHNRHDNRCTTQHEA